MTIAKSSRVFLSASIPPIDLVELRKREDAWEDYYLGYVASPNEIEAAVRAIAAHLLAAQATLVFGGHPAITPIVADIGRRVQRTNDGISIEIYQSAFFAGREPFERNDRTVYRHVQWTPVCRASDDGPEPETGPFALGEYPLDRADHRRALRDLERLDEEETKQRRAASLKAMRRQMIRGCDVALFIGGMKGIEDELILFEELNPGNPVWLVTRPGGRTERIARTQELRPHRRIEESVDYDSIALKMLDSE